MKKLLSVSLLVAALNVQAADTATTATTDTKSPKGTCDSLIDAAKKDDFGAVQNMTMMPEHHNKNMAKMKKKGFDKMHNEYISSIKDMSCGSEMIAGDRAVVTAEAKDQKRLIPFVQTEGQWKFDVKAYRAFYDTDKKGAKHKSM